MIPVSRIRPEEGLGRKRERAGHQELCRSISRFGVLTPITVRRAPGKPQDFLLVKGQGRTLACLHLGIKTIPAHIVEESFSEEEKVQQFLVENVARLRMKPVDRALLIARARSAGEETKKVAERFGISPSTVRKLEGQLSGAGDAEIAALRRGDVSLATQAIVARLVSPEDRSEVIAIVSEFRPPGSELQMLLVGVGWQTLTSLGPKHQRGRIALLRWACSRLADMPKGTSKTRLMRLAAELPLEMDAVQERGVG